MNDKKNRTPVVFTPSNEPYLGRQSVFHFDQVIISCMEVNHNVATYTHTHELNDLQKAACQIIPQGINLALSIRELVRQGYLFPAAILMRPLIERAAIISYLCEKPEDVSLWKDGWKYGKRPSLARMLKTMHGEVDIEQTKRICETFNHLIHGDPIGSSFNLINFREESLGYAVGKIFDESELCDFVCFQSYLYLIVLMARMAQCFQEIKFQ
jgi:hypothetical protein